MSVDAIIRVSFQSEVTANQDVNEALVGHKQDSKGTGPFQKVNTAVYSCTGADDEKVHKALDKLVKTIGQHHYSLDFLSVSLTKRHD